MGKFLPLPLTPACRLSHFHYWDSVPGWLGGAMEFAKYCGENTPTISNSALLNSCPHLPVHTLKITTDNIQALGLFLKGI